MVTYLLADHVFIFWRLVIISRQTAVGGESSSRGTVNGSGGDGGGGEGGL